MAVDKTAEREERLRALQEKLTSGVEQLVTGEDWKRAIEFAARFRSRSFSNTLLIALAHAEAFEKGLVPSPYPTYVAGYKQWQQLDRHVRRGMSGYQIVAPVVARFASSNPADPDSWRRVRRGEPASPGEVTRSRMVGVRPAYVWDVSGTDGPDVPERPIPVLLKGQAPPGLREGLVAEIEANGFRVVEVPDAVSIHGANGLTDFVSRTVSYRVDVDDASQVRTLGHELGHLLMHDPSNGDWVQHRGIGEVEAESFALMLSAAHQMDSSDYTIPYVASWADSVPGKTPVEVVQATADKVCKIASQVLARLDTAQVGDGTPQGLAGAGRGVDEARDRAVPDVARVTDAMPPTPMDPWSTSAGDRFLRGGQMWQAVRITPAGANGTSRLDGPTIHAKIVREDGTLSDYTADIWSKSISNPPSAYTRLESPTGDEVDVSQSTVTLGDALPSAGEAMAVTAHTHDRLDRLQHGGPVQTPGGALSPAPGLGV